MSHLSRYQLRCIACGLLFSARNANALYCGGTCRQRTWRRRKAANALAPAKPANHMDVRQWNGTPISRRADGWVNATAMCQAGGREWFTYARASRTQEYIAALAGVLGSPQNCGDPFAGSPQNPATVVIQSITTGPNHLRGTWIHPRLAVDLARWISPAFAVWMDGWFLESLTHSPTTHRQPQADAYGYGITIRASSADHAHHIWRDAVWRHLANANREDLNGLFHVVPG